MDVPARVSVNVIAIIKSELTNFVNAARQSATLAEPDDAAHVSPGDGKTPEIRIFRNTMNPAAMVYIDIFCVEAIRFDQCRHIAVHMVKIGEANKDVVLEDLDSAACIIAAIIQQLLTNSIGVFGSKPFPG